MAEAKPGDTVQIHYAGRLQDGTVFDSSEGRDPLAFELGSGQVIEGVDQAVSGLAVGDKTTTEIPPEKAYGPRAPELVLKVQRSQFPEGVTPKVGERFEMRTQNGETVPVTVTEAGEQSIEIDANHPLAGHTLTFDIELIAIS